MPSSLLNDIPANSNRFLSDFSNDTISYQWKSVRNGRQEGTLSTRSWPRSFGSISVSCAQNVSYLTTIFPFPFLRLYAECLYHTNVFHLNTEFLLSNNVLHGLKKLWTCLCYRKSQYFKTLLMGTADKKQNLHYKFFQSLQYILKHVRQYLHTVIFRVCLSNCLYSLQKYTLTLWAMSTQASGTGLGREVKIWYQFVYITGPQWIHRAESYGYILWGAKAWNL